MHETNFPNGILLENLKNGVNGILTVDNSGIVSVSSTNVNSINNLYSTYTNSSTTQAISAGLNSRLTSNELLDSQQTNSINTLFSTYTNSATTSAISAGLDSRITANNLVDTQQTNSINTLFSTYTNSATTQAISAGLNTRTNNNTNSINTLFSTYTNSATTQAISAGLDARITANSTATLINSINTLYSTYANSSTVAAISAGLNSRLTANELLDTQQTNSINTLYSTYTNSATTQAISAGLQSQINSIVQEGTTISSSAGTIVYNKSGINYNLEVANYIGKTEVSLISAGLDSRITANNLIDTQQTNSINNLYSTYTNSATTQAISAGLNSRLTSNELLDTQQTNSINTLYSTYTNSATTQAISAGLNSRLTANELLDTQQTNSINTLFSTYTNSSTVAAISAGLQSQINSIVQEGTTISSSGGTIVYNKSGINYNLEVADYIGKTEVALISAGLNSRLTANELLDFQQAASINDLYSTYAHSTTVSAISAGLDSRLASNELLDAQQTNSINDIYSTYTNSATTSAISAGLDTRIGLLLSNTNGITGGLDQLDSRFVNISGDTMVGKLVLSPSTSNQASLRLISGDMVTTSVSGDIWYHDEGDGNGLFINTGGVIKQLDRGINTAGPIEKIVLTNNGDGTINVPSIIVYLYENSNWSGSYRHFHVPAANNLVLTDGLTNYLVADYNGGSPIYSITTNPALINNSNVALVATMSRWGNEIHWIPVDWGLATAIKLNNRQINITRYERSSGLILGETASRIITATSGVVWYGASSNAESAVTSSPSGADFWYHVAGNWTKNIVSTYDNTYYDNGTDLVAVGGTRYCVNWVFRYLDGSGLPKLAYVVGTGNYTLSQARDSTVPTIPTILDRSSILIGRIIVGSGDSIATQIDSAFTQVFAGSSATDHNDLGGLQGGTINEYYHLTSSEMVDYIGATEVALISSGLNSRLTSNELLDIQQTASINTLFSTYANSSTVASISAGLDARITSSDLINSQQTASINTLFSTYTNSTTTQAISAGLQSQINAIVQEGTTISSSGGSILVTQVGLDYNLEVASAPVSNHNDLLGIQGGTTNEYYHLTASEYSNISGGGIQGRVVCTTASTYTITHPTINPLQEFPVASLEVSSDSSDLFVQGIYDRTATSFKVVLSGTPSSANAILYHISTQRSANLDYVPLNGLNSTFTYDLSGSLETLTTSRGSKTFNYNGSGQLVSISGSGEYVNKSFSYDLDGNLIGITLG